VPWQAGRVATRVAALALLLALGGTACSGDPSSSGPSPSAAPSTSDADCAARIPDDVFTTLGWSAPSAAEATVRGCHREAQQGYVEVRDRSGYDRLCATLDRTGGVGPGVPVDWLGDATACAVELPGDVGQTRVVVRGADGAAVQVTVAVLTATPRDRVREAVARLVG
jgi:hypothetical protein